MPMVVVWVGALLLSCDYMSSQSSISKRKRKTKDECAPSGSWARPFVSFFGKGLGAAAAVAVLVECWLAFHFFYYRWMLLALPPLGPVLDCPERCDRRRPIVIPQSHSRFGHSSHHAFFVVLLGTQYARSLDYALPPFVGIHNICVLICARWTWSGSRPDPPSSSQRF